MYQYLIDKDQEFTTDKVGRIISDFTTRILPKYKRWKNYYDGNHDILNKKSEDRQYRHVITNFCKYIADTYQGYLADIPVQYDNDNFDEILDILKWNDYVNEDSDLMLQALQYGRSFELNYLDEEAKSRFKSLSSLECIPVYDNTINQELQYVIQFWAEELDGSPYEDKYFVSVYGPNDIKKYESTVGFTSFTLIEQIPHYFGQCPVSVFSLNKDEVCIFDQIITLQDAYNETVSSAVDGENYFNDAYLMLQGCDADEKTLASIKKNRVLMLPEGCDAKYLIKDVTGTQTLQLINNFKQNIHKIANCPDFTDEAFMSQSGIAIRYKLVGMETTASNIAANFVKALQRRIELISSILNLTSENEALWREVKIKVSRNLPVEINDTVQMISQLRGLVSDKTLLGQLPFISDVDKELAEIKRQREEQIDLYGFDMEQQSKKEIEEDEE